VGTDCITGSVARMAKTGSRRDAQGAILTQEEMGLVLDDFLYQASSFARDLPFVILESC
jgi:hypothetical protein